MFEFKEFMIGDWIYKDDKPHRFEVKDYEGDSEFSWKAIPITIEFLKNNGFKQDKGVSTEEYVLYGDWGRMLYVPEWKGFYVMKGDASCNLYAVVECVHEVQQMIRFAKLNDIADNLKVE